MYEVSDKTIPTNAVTIFRTLLFLYPSAYQKRYAAEISLLFQDLYRDELVKHGKAGIRFWFSQSTDILKSVLGEHINEINKKGMKKYLKQDLYINNYNIFGGLLLMPFIILLGVDLISRIFQSDLTHTPFYWPPFLFVWILLFPAIAVFINLIPIAEYMRKGQKEMFGSLFFKQNIVTLILLGIGLILLTFLPLHDFIPCMFHNLTH